ncbi:MAG: ABC transporter substrate-binding protein [Caldilineaceae bacterium]|nr:ABC transporter substrate-binding protein [Caldilineaceae bacterium]
MTGLTACVPVATPAVPPTSEAAPAATAAGALAITDGSGVTLTFDTPPQRIVCLYTRCTEVLATLGLTPVALPSWIAEIASEPAYFPQPNEIVILAPTNDDLGFDLEELAALKPDLVLGWEELRPALEGIAPLHAVANGMDSYQESNDEIRAFAHIFGREAEAEVAIQAFLDRLAAYQALSPRDRSIINLWAGDGSIVYRDGESGTCKLLKEVAECAWPDPANADTWSVQTTIEGLLQLDPDFILYDDWAEAYADQDALLAGLGSDPLWQELSAYKSGQIIETPATLYNLDGMGTVGATRMLDTLLPLLYPDVFPTALTDAEVAETLAK